MSVLLKHYCPINVRFTGNGECTYIHQITGVFIPGCEYLILYLFCAKNNYSCLFRDPQVTLAQQGYKDQKDPVV